MFGGRGPPPEGGRQIVDDVDQDDHGPGQGPALTAAPAVPRPVRSLAERRHAAAVEQMAAELAKAYPVPVDLVEDDLARKLGLAALARYTPSDVRAGA